ncbi:hypothetical protein HID58_086513 [Brassica napus]|uniref:Uncharacterized protein n=1 Tax=Brassica napus TaxID=3708 RepID=A0ABQ7XSG6_BRANA|nr:hypothetical protein HID58_086513 [Brassica napus]
MLSTSPPSSILFTVRSTMTTHHDRRVSRFSRRCLCLLSSSPSEKRWKPTTIDDSRRLDGDSSIFCRLRNGGNPPRSTTLGDLTATPPSSVVFGVRGTMERATTLSVYSVALSDGSHVLFNFQINYPSSVRKISLSAILERKKSPNRLYRRRIKTGSSQVISTPLFKLLEAYHPLSVRLVCKLDLITYVNKCLELGDGN